jgi:hypothetical protein
LGQLALLGLLAIVAATSTASAADSLYDVAKISVDTTAENAVAARNIGIAEVEMRALKIVLGRLVPLGAQGQLPELSKDEVAGMVDGVSIRNEQNSTIRYIGLLDVSLNPQAVRQLLVSRGIPYSENRAPQTFILPLVLSGDKVVSEGPEAWLQAWEGLDLSHSVTPATILRPRQELDAVTVKAILAGDEQALEGLQNAYAHGPLVLAVGEAAGGKFTTRLVGNDGVGAISYGHADNLGGTDARQAARGAAAAAFAILENRWKMMESGGPLPAEASSEGGAPGAEQTQPPREPAEVPRNVVAMVEFSGLRDWQQIRSRLTHIAGLQGLEVNALSARSASITFDFAGSLDRLQAALGQNGFALYDKNGTFVLRSQ